MDYMEASSLSSNYLIIQQPYIMYFSIMYYLITIFLFSLVKDDYDLNFRNIKELLFCHNVISILSSIYIFTGILYEVTTNNYYIIGNDLIENHSNLTHYIWIFHLTKYYEFMDTLIMILRRSFRQITFLHVYHHVSVVIYTWLVLYNHPGGDYYLGSLLNSWVHMWMYVYYLMASMLSKENRKKYLWWSRYLTKMQIIQFVINSFHCIYAMNYSEIQTPLYKIGLFHQFTFLLLFGNFYFKKYKSIKEQ